MQSYSLIFKQTDIGMFISTAIDISLANLKLGAQLGWIRANIQNNQIEWNWCQDCSTATEVSGANLKVSAQLG